jgi:hypothetical protein
MFHFPTTDGFATAVRSLCIAENVRMLSCTARQVCYVLGCELLLPRIQGMLEEQGGLSYIGWFERGKRHGKGVELRDGLKWVGRWVSAPVFPSFFC